MRSFTDMEMTEVPRLIPVRALEAVDGIPTLVEMCDERGRAWLKLWVDCSDTCDRWLYSRPDPSALEGYLDGTHALFDIFWRDGMPPWLLVDQPRSEPWPGATALAYYIVRLPEEYLPEQDVSYRDRVN